MRVQSEEESFLMRGTKNIWGLNIKIQETSSIFFGVKFFKSMHFYMEGQGPSILDFGASVHIFPNSSSSSFISFPKILHLVTVVNGSKIASQGIDQVLYLFL